MFEAITNIDSAVLLWIQAYLRVPVLTPVMKAITYLGNAGIIWITIIIGLLCFKKTRRIGVICFFSLLCEYLINDFLIKPVVGRIRPYEVIAGLRLLISKQKDFSFPSGHSASSFACACIIFRMAPRKYGIASLLLASLIAFSRLYVGVHYPSDVICGILLGILVSTAVYHISDEIHDKMMKRGTASE